MEDVNTKKKMFFFFLWTSKNTVLQNPLYKNSPTLKKLYEMEQEKKSLKQREARFLSDVFAAVAVVVA